MKNFVPNNAQAVIQYCPVFTGRSKDAFSEYVSNVRVCLSLYSKPVFEVFQGAEQPSSTVQDGDIKRVDIPLERKWKQVDQDLWSVLFLTTSGSANNVVRRFEGKQPEDGIGTGRRLWRL